MSYTSPHVPLWLWHWYWLWFQFIWANHPSNNWMKPHWTSCSANHAPGLRIFIHCPWPGLAWNWMMLAWAWNSCLLTDNQEHGVVLITPRHLSFHGSSSLPSAPGSWTLLGCYIAAACPLPSLSEGLSWPCLACISQSPLWLLPYTVSLLSGMSLLLQGPLPHQPLRTWGACCA